jgi:hypothetical protein
MMKTLSEIPFTLDADQIIAQSHVEAGSSIAADLPALIELAQKIGRPKAAFALCFITKRDGDRVHINDACFRSRTMAHNLESTERIFPFVATCGHELDQGFLEKGDMIKEFWWDLIKTCLLVAANEYLNDYLLRKFRLGRMVTMHPGSGDVSVWPIEQQKDLFSLLGNVEKDLGVQLTDSFLMIPNKTISGIMFPSEKDFRSCEVCHRENCPSRRAHFNKVLWEEIQNN